MPYSIRTTDGIVIRNIPDDVDRNSEELKARVARERENKRARNVVTQDVEIMRKGNPLMRGLRGAGATLQNAGYGIQDIFTDLSPEQQRNIAANKQFLNEDTAGAVGGFAGDVLSFALPGGLIGKAVTKGATMLPRAARAVSGLGANTALDAALSAAYATEDRGQAALLGGLSSLGGQGVARVLTGAVKPSDAARRLMDFNIQPTIGQAADQTTFTGRALRRGEEIVESWPLIGGIIRNARERAANEVAEVAGRRAVAPGGVPQEITREGIDKLYRQFDQPYSVIKQFNFTPDAQLNSGISNIIADPNFRALPDTRKGVLEFINNNLSAKLQNGTLSGAAFKDLDSEIGKRLRDLAGDTGAEARAERRILTAIENEIGAWRNRNLPQDVVEQLKDTDRAYAAWKRLARAGKYSNDEKISPSQLTRAVRAMSQGDDFARGRAFMQDLTDPASILRSRTPNSGTADRLAGMGLVTGTIANPAAFLPYAAGAAGLAGAYTRPGQKFLLGGYDRQKAIEDALRRYNLNQYFGDVGAALVDE